MQKRSEELQLAVQEYLDVDWTNVKHYLSRQIAKCVNECKSQASNAKRIVFTTKPQSKEKSTVDPNPDDYESDEYSDGWDTDFDDDFEDELNEHASSFPELNNNSIKQNTSESNEKVKTNATLLNRVIQNPPHQPAVITSYNSNGLKCVSTFPRPPCVNNIPRPPLKRPPSQPPPPPRPQSSSQEDPHEDYEIPINPVVNQIPASLRTFSSPFVLLPTAAPPKSELHKTSPKFSTVEEPVETYEIIQPVEENYEIVDAAPPFPPKTTEKPALPPRIPVSLTGSPPPPPLPQKPRKLLENSITQQKAESHRPLTRPKLPIKTEDEGYHETALSTAVGTIGTTILQSIMGRRSSTPTSSPKLISKNINGSEFVLSSNVSIDSQSSRSSSPEKEGLITVGSSSFISTSLSAELAKSSPPELPPRTVLIMPEEIAQNMATRPLPPVPTVAPESMLNKQQDVHLYPWFHEIERQEAEQEVKKMTQSGAFLVRYSKRAGIENPYTVTVLNEGKIFHLNIRRRPDDTFALGKEKKKEKTFLSVADLIAYHQSEPILLTSRGESAGQTILHVFPEK